MSPELDQQVDSHITTEQATEEILSHEFVFLTGNAGTGKSYLLKQGQENGKLNAAVGASTGIAAVNLGTQTINSWLKFFDTFSLRQNRFDGKLKKIIGKLANTYSQLVWDEVSMTPQQQVQSVYDEIAELNHDRKLEDKPPFRLILTGDFLQLPPIPEKGQPTPWAFKADCWDKFHVVRLTKVWRQSNPILLDAINAIRSGNGALGAELLIKGGVQFASGIDPDFDGTTIVSKNDKVNKFNQDALNKLAGNVQIATSQYWWAERGRKVPSEWKNIPGSHTEDFYTQDLKLKLGAYVMILANDTSINKAWVNGDCGWIEDMVMGLDNTIDHVVIRLARNNEEVKIGKIVRDSLSADHPAHMNPKEITEVNDEKGHVGYLDGNVVKSKKNKRYIVGQIEYLPVRLAYATTIHKSQGLSLAKVQIDMTDNFFGNPAMGYVAFSRAQTLEGMRIVGNGKLLAQRVKLDPETRMFL